MRDPSHRSTKIAEADLDEIWLYIAGDGDLRRTLGEFVSHCHRARNHQGLDNALI